MTSGGNETMSNTRLRGLSGVFSPMLTAFTEAGEPDEQAFLDHASWLLEDGCHGLVPFGTTSEANSLGVYERMGLLEALVGSGIAPEKLLPGTGLCALSDTVTLTRHAVQLGCAGVLLLPPFYYKGVSDDGLFRYVADVIEQVNDNRLRIYLYHIPPVAVVGYALPLVKRLVGAFPDIIVGLKDSSGDWAYTDALLKAIPGFSVFSGNEDFLLNNRRSGGAGTITAMTNINSRAIRALFDGWEGADAEERQAQISAVRALVREAGTIPGLKAVLAHYRAKPSLALTRPPLMPLDAAAQKRLVEALASEQGFTLSF